MDRCQNCGQPVSGAYCAHCGQKVYLERISFSFFIHEIIHFFTHLEHGFLHTTWQLLRSPGRMVTEYIAGKRKPHQSPVSYFLIWTTIFILTLYAFVKIFGEDNVIAYKDYFGPGASTAFAISNLSFILAFIIPFQAFYLYLFLTHSKYNYSETLVMAIYAVGTIIFLQFAFALFSLAEFAFTAHPSDLRYSDILKAGYFVWFTSHLVRILPVSNKWIRALIFILLAAGTFTAWRLFVVPWVSGFFLHQA